MMTQATGIVILGMHRSGTSVLAEMVHSWGAVVGAPEHLIAGDECNPYGYWERRDLVTLNEDLLSSCNATSWCPPPDTANERLRAMGLCSDSREAASELLRRVTGRRPWMLKDPRLCVLLPFWQCVWPQVLYIVVFRHPLAVAESLQARDRFSLHAGLLLWQRYMSCILSHTGDATRIFVSYESIINDLPACVSKLCRFLDSQLCMHGDTSNIASVVRPSACHHRGQGRTDTSSLTQSQAELHNALMMLEADPFATVQTQSLQMPLGWRSDLSTPTRGVR